MDSAKLKHHLLLIAKQCAKQQLVAGTSGNMSLYCAEEKIMFITPSSLPYETMNDNDIVMMELSGHCLESGKKPSSEWPMHAAIYQARSDITGIVHTHSPYATAFAVCQQVIPVILIEMVPHLGGEVPVAKFALPGSTALGECCLKILHDRKACLMSNHGALSIGKTLDDAYNTAIYLEDAAKIYQLAKSIGEPVILDTATVNKMK